MGGPIWYGDAYLPSLADLLQNLKILKVQYGKQAKNQDISRP